MFLLCFLKWLWSQEKFPASELQEYGAVNQKRAFKKKKQQQQQQQQQQQANNTLNAFILNT